MLVSVTTLTIVEQTTPSSSTRTHHLPGNNSSCRPQIYPPQLRLYSTSTLERHHLNQALVILNLEGNQILKNLNEEEYSATLAVVEEAILATDLSLHFKHLGALKALASKVTIVKKKLSSFSACDQNFRVLKVLTGTILVCHEQQRQP